MLRARLWTACLVVRPGCRAVRVPRGGHGLVGVRLLDGHRGQKRWRPCAVCGLQERLQGGASWGFLFDGVPAGKAATGESSHRVGAFRRRGDSVAGQGAEGFALMVLARADVDDHATGLWREVVMDSSRDADSAEVGVGTDHDVVDADGGLVDQVKERVRWLAVAPDHRGVGVGVADGFGCLPVFDDEQYAGVWGDIEGDGAVGW